MPKFQDAVALSQTDNDSALAVAYQTFKTLGWEVQYAGDDKLLAHTPKTWKTKGQQIIAGYEGASLTIQSEMIYGESFDLSGINKKNVAAFKGAFVNILSNIDPNTTATNINAIRAIREETRVAAEQQAKEAEEVNKAMHLAGSNLYVTYAIIAINILVFILMVVDGAGIMDLNGLVHIKWGSNFSPLTLSGDWWRLITNTFIHFGVIHLLMNMYCLYTIGVYLEPMLGKAKYATAYLCTGIMASLTSLWWHTDPVNSAGASGAVFGMYGLFAALLTTDLIPARVRNSLLQSIGIFIIFNLAYGMKGGVDNSAHVGGLISGFIFGYLFVIAIKAEQKGKKASWALPAIILLSVGISFSFLSTHPGSADERNKVLAELKNGSFKDSEKFDERYNEFVNLQTTALAPFDSAYSNEVLDAKLNEISIPAWSKGEAIAEQLQQMDVSPANHKKADAVLEYITLRKQQVALAKRMITNDTSAMGEKDELNEKINAASEKINHQ